MYLLEIFQREEYFVAYTDGVLYRARYFVIHIPVFKTKTMDNNILYDVMYASLSSPFIFYVLPSVLLVLIQ